MSLAIKALGRGVKRIIAIPRLSLSLIIALGSTLGAVLCVTAIVSALIVKPLPGINNAPLLKDLDLKVTFGGSLALDFITPHGLHHMAQHFKDIGDWTSVEPQRNSVSINQIDHVITLFDANINATDVLGTQLILGDDINSDNIDSHVWLSNSLWQSAYLGLSSAIGNTLTLDGKRYTIAGVFEDALAITTNEPILPNQIWRHEDFSLAPPMSNTDNIGNNSLENIIFKPHNEQTNLPTNDDISQWFDTYVDTQISKPAIRDFIKRMPMNSTISDYRTSFLDTNYNLVIALSITALGLLIMASLNLTNLFLSHYQSRHKEFAIQLSLGATPLKLKLLMVMENLPSFALAGTFGGLLGAWLIKALPLFSNNEMPLLSAISLDQLTLICGVFIVISLSVVFGFLSTAGIDKHSLQNSLSSSGKGTAAQSNNTISRTLMVLQISIASILMTGSVMLAKDTLGRVYQDLGFNIESAQQLSFTINDEQWLESLIKGNEEDKINNEFQTFISQLKADITQIIPDSKVVLVNDGGLLGGSISLRSNSSTENPEQQITFQVARYDAGFFKAMAIPVLAGSPLTAQEIADNVKKVTIDERFAKELYPGMAYQDIIGQLLPYSEELVVAAIVAETGFAKSRVAPSTYTPYHSISNRVTFTLVMPQGSNLSVNSLNTHFAKRYPQIELTRAESVPDIWAEMTAASRLTLYVLIAITLLTITLAAIGISGLTLMTTHQKKYELAIRMATGARQLALIKFIAKDTLWVLALGLIIGFAISVASYNKLQESFSLLPEFNWLTIGSLDIGLILVVILSVLIPTWRVIRQDPLNALRQE